MIRVLLLCLVLVFLLVPAHGAPKRAVKYPAWITKRECERLMRYHGVLGLRLKDGAVSIKRNGEWIVVSKDVP